MKRLLTVFAGILVAIAPAGFSGAAFAQATASNQADLMHLRTISVSGEAHEDVAPDQAVLSMSLTSKAKELQEAKTHNDALIEKLVQITREYNIPKEKVSTSGIYISPEYNYLNNQQTFIGYTVNRTFRVTIDDLSKQERLLSAIVQAKIDQVNGVEFQLADRDKYSDKLRLKAFENAKAKATALAQAAGDKLGHAISISTEGQVEMPPRPIMRPMMAKAAMSAEPSVAPSLPGMVTIGENIQVVFALE